MISSLPFIVIPPGDFAGRPDVTPAALGREVLVQTGEALNPLAEAQGDRTRRL
jgi:hypothetical protein